MVKKLNTSKEGSSKVVVGLLVVALLLGLWNFATNYQLRQSLERLDTKIGELRGDRDQETVDDGPATRPQSLRITKKMGIVAVSDQGKGIIGNLTLEMIPGNNNVLINTNPFLETDIQQATNRAVAVAKTRSNYNYDKDFIFKFDMGGAQLVGGSSAGAATTILTLAALQNKTINKNAVITGTINSDGTIGRVGGLLEKLEAAAEAGYQQFLLPDKQLEFTYYEKKVTREPFGFGFEFLSTEYIPKTVNLKNLAKKQWGMTAIGVANITEAQTYLLKENK